MKKQALIDYCNKNWNLPQYEIERAWDIMGEYRCPLSQASDEVLSHLRSLIEDFVSENDLSEDWFYENFGDEEELFNKIDPFAKEDAVFNQKDLCDDWIEDIFDYANCISATKDDMYTFVGFVMNTPVVASYKKNTNVLRWQIVDESDRQTTLVKGGLLQLLKKSDEGCSIECDYQEEGNNVIYQFFYHKKEEE